MRKNHVLALLEHAKNDLIAIIEPKYKESLTLKNVPASLQIDIKNYMENLRSALDYLAHDIYEKIIKPNQPTTKKIENIHFPYGKTENDFKSRMESNLPGLQTLNPAVFKLIEELQPFKRKYDWLYQFCKIVNEKKHDKLTPQEKSETETMTASIQNGDVTIPINNPHLDIKQGEEAIVTIGGVPVRFDNKGIHPLGPGLKRTITTWISFTFKDTDIPVLWLLERALEEINKLSDEIYKELEDL